MKLWLDRWYDDLPEVSGTVGKVVALVATGVDGRLSSVEHVDLTPEHGVAGDDRGSQVFVVRFAAMQALAEDSGVDPLTSGDHLFVELDLSRASLPPGSALTIGTAILGVREANHAPDREFRRAFGSRAMRRVRRHNRRQSGGRRLACPVLQPGRVTVGDTVYAKAIGIRFQP